MRARLTLRIVLAVLWSDCKPTGAYQALGAARLQGRQG